MTVREQSTQINCLLVLGHRHRSISMLGHNLAWSSEHRARLIQTIGKVTAMGLISLKSNSLEKNSQFVSFGQIASFSHTS
jgi:hypothetical protein